MGNNILTKISKIMKTEVFRCIKVSKTMNKMNKKGKTITIKKMKIQTKILKITKIMNRMKDQKLKKIWREILKMLDFVKINKTRITIKKSNKTFRLMMIMIRSRINPRSNSFRIDLKKNQMSNLKLKLNQSKSQIRKYLILKCMSIN